MNKYYTYEELKSRAEKREKFRYKMKICIYSFCLLGILFYIIIPFSKISTSISSPSPDNHSRLDSLEKLILQSETFQNFLLIAKKNNNLSLAEYVHKNNKIRITQEVFHDVDVTLATLHHEIFHSAFEHNKKKWDAKFDSIIYANKINVRNEDLTQWGLIEFKVDIITLNEISQLGGFRAAVKYSYIRNLGKHITFSFYQNAIIKSQSSEFKNSIFNYEEKDRTPLSLELDRIKKLKN